MLRVGDQVICYVDDIEKYRQFQVIKVEPNQRYVLKGIDTDTQLCRVLDNSIGHKIFSYKKVQVISKGD